MQNDLGHIVIKPVLGMGDQFICSGIIRHWIKHKNFSKIDVITRTYQYDTIKQLYADNKKINVVAILEQDEWRSRWTKIYEKNTRILRVGTYDNSGDKFDVVFYKSFGLDIEDKWKHFKINRDEKREQECFDEYVKGEYIFVHDQSSIGNHELNIKTNLQIIKPTDFKYGPFDFLKIIENAKEIHCVDSCFLSLIDLLQISGHKYFHTIKDNEIREIIKNKQTNHNVWSLYKDKDNEFSPTLKCDWTRINY